MSVDGRAHLDGRLVGERLADLQRLIGAFDARLGDRVDLVLLRRVDERLLHQLLGDLALHVLAEALLEDRARDLALAEAVHLHLRAELLVSAVELVAHRLPGDLDGELLFDGG